MVRKLKFVKLISVARKAGVVTRRYPFEAPLVTDEFRGEVRLDPKKCIGCGACTIICPPNALTLHDEGDVRVIRYFVGRCIFCGMCAEVCPTNAITITKEFELASVTTEQLLRDLVHDRVKCRVCGRYFLPVKLVKTANGEVPGSSNYVDVCPECRAKLSLKGILEHRMG